jgi:uncharacterized OsmC-like protein
LDAQEAVMIQSARSHQHNHAHHHGVPVAVTGVLARHHEPGTAGDRIEIRHVTGDRYTVQIRGHQLTVDQPWHAGGEDAGPTPTELFAASLAACVAHYGGRFLARHGIDPGDLRVDCEFALTTSPNRVGSIALRVVPPAEMPPRLTEAMRAVVSRCTVSNTIVEPPDMQLAMGAEEFEF